jgi:YD repeat-containing protein
VGATGDTTEYRYEERTMSIFHNGSLLLRTEYDEDDRVIRATLNNGRVYSFAYTVNINNDVVAVEMHDSAGPSIRFDLTDTSAYTSQIIN